MPLGGLIPYGPTTGDIRRKLQQQLMIQKLLGGSRVSAAPLFGTGRTNRLGANKPPAFVDFAPDTGFTRPRFNQPGGLGGSLIRRLPRGATPGINPSGGDPRIGMPARPPFLIETRGMGRLPRGATPGINPHGGDGRIGLPTGGVRGPRRMARRPIMRPRASGPRVVAPRARVSANAPASPRPRPAMRASLRAPSQRILVHQTPATRPRRIHPVMRLPAHREVRMGVRRAESARSTRPSVTRFVGGINMRNRVQLV